MEEEKRSYFCNCLYFSANSLARNMTRLAEEAFSRTGMSPSHAFVLMTVNRIPGISPSALADEMHMKPSTITRFVDKLESKGFLNRESEGKTIRIFPTDKSKDMSELLLEGWEKLYETYKEMLGPNMTKLLTNNISEANERIK